jgi:hypothetical protein
MLDWEIFFVPAFDLFKFGSGETPSDHEMGDRPHVTMSD